MTFKFLSHLRPTLELTSVFDVLWDNLLKQQRRHLLFDLDNTLLPWGEGKFSNDHLSLLQRLHDDGFSLSVLTNSKLQGREQFLLEQLEPLDVVLVKDARKPLPAGFIKALKAQNALPGQAAVIGDQRLTDVVGGNRLGLMTILVNPIAPDKEPGWARRRRALERLLAGFAKKADRRPQSPPASLCL